MATKEATMSDVLNAVKGVGSKVEALAGRVEAIDRRVNALEQKKAVKPREVAPAPVAAPPAVDDQEDELIKSGSWQKMTKVSSCNRVSITKTRKRDSWKLLLHLPGVRRPATFIAWDGPQAAVDFFAEVLPWLSLDHFDEEQWAVLDDASTTPPVLYNSEAEGQAVACKVEWFRTQPNATGQTFINVESVFPIYEE